MENTFLIVIGIAVLLFIWLLWLRQNLLIDFREAMHQEKLLKRDLEKRRDTVPFLLESLRGEESLKNDWHRILTERQVFQDKFTNEDEWAFEKSLLEFITKPQNKSVHFLEAKKDIEDLSVLVEKEKLHLQEVVNRFNQRRKQFPYSVASAIFAFRKMNL